MRALLILASLLLLSFLAFTLFFAPAGEEAPAVGLDGSNSTSNPASSESAASPSGAKMVAPEAGEMPDAADTRLAVEADPIGSTANEGAAERSTSAGRALVVGRIVDESGRPVAGARVRAEDPGRSFLIGREPARAGADAQTDARGRFELAVEPGNWQLSVLAEAFAPAEQTVRVQLASTEDIGDWELDAGVVLEGRVLGPDLRPVAGANLHRLWATNRPGIRIVSSVYEAVVTTTDEDGFFKIGSQPVGEYGFIVAHEAFPDGFLAGETEFTGQRVQGLEVVLEPGVEIAGRVLDAPADELDGLVVRASKLDQGALVIGEVATDTPAQKMRRAELEADGSFVLRGLQAGTEYRVTTWLEGGNFGSSRTAPQVVASGSRGVELAYSPGATLVFQAVDASTGDPVTAFEAEAGSQVLTQLVDESGRVIEQHPDGRASFEGVRVESGTPVTLLVRSVGYEDHQLDDLAVEPGEVKDLGVLRLRRTPVVRVTVTDSDGAPVVGAKVTLRPVEEETAGVRRRSISMRRRVTDDGEDTSVSFADGSRSGKTNDAGLCELSSFPGQTASIRVSSPAFAAYLSVALRLPSVEDYDYAVELNLGGIVEVQVLDVAGEPLVDAMVEHRAPRGAGGGLSIGDFQAPSRTGDDGIARFERLEAGDHLFRLSEKRDSGGFAFVTSTSGAPSTEGWDVVTVAGGETYALTLEASPGASLTGRLTEGGEPLAGATLRLVSPDQEGDSLGLAMLGGGGGGTQTDPSGAFEFSDETAGSYKLEITHPERAMPAEYEVELFAGENRETIDLPLTVVAGKITDSDGQPIVGATVQAQRHEGGAQGGRVMMMMTVSDGGGATTITAGGAQSSTAQTDEEGRYELRGVQPEVEIVVEASSPSHRSETSDPFRVDPGAERNGVDMELAPAGRIQVVATRDGRPTGNQLVRASFMGDSEEPVSPEVAVLRNDGKAELTGLQAGPWRIRVTGFQNPNGEGAPEQTIDVVPGETKEALFEL